MSGDNSETPKLPHPKSPEMQEHFLALGEFIHNFSYVESGLLGLLLVLTKITPAEAAHVVLRDISVSTAVPMIGRLLQVRGLDQVTVETYRHLSTQIGEIAKARNAIVHSGLTFGSDGQPQVKRVLPAIAGIGAAPRPMPPETIRDMAADLHVILHGLIKLFMRIAVLTGIGQGTLDPSPETAPSWRYKPPSSNAISPDRRRRQDS